MVEDRGLYIESWLPERRSRRRPLYYLHGELAGSWLWEQYLRYFAQRGWEGHALNLRAHFWSETAPLEELDVDTYVDDAVAGYDALDRSSVVIGHGLGGLLGLKVAEARDVDALVLLSAAIPAPMRPVPPPHVVRLVPAVYQAELIDWAGALEHIQRQNQDLTLDDVRRIQHLLGAESGAVRRQMLAGVHVARQRLPDVPCLSSGPGWTVSSPSLTVPAWPIGSAPSTSPLAPTRTTASSPESRPTTRWPTRSAPSSNTIASRQEERPRGAVRGRR